MKAMTTLVVSIHFPDLGQNSMLPSGPQARCDLWSIAGLAISLCIYGCCIRRWFHCCRALCVAQVVHLYVRRITGRPHRCCPGDCRQQVHIPNTLQSGFEPSTKPLSDQVPRVVNFDDLMEIAIYSVGRLCFPEGSSTWPVDGMFGRMVVCLRRILLVRMRNK